MERNDSLTLPLVHALVDRGATVINVYVPLHEVEVLKAVHGVDGSVRVQGPADGDVVDLEISADAEIDRLKRKYPPRRPEDPCPVRTAFPMGVQMLERIGFEAGRGSVSAPRNSVVNHKKLAEAANAAKSKK
jgi:hypothetical protein